MKIVLLGYRGMLGHDVNDFLSDKHELILLGRLECDITNKKDVENLFERERFEGIINCSAYTAVDKAEKEKGQAALVNSIGVKNLVDCCMDYNRFLYHISTDYVFDGTKGKPYYEHDIPYPVNYYGMTKKWGEDHVKLMGQKGLIIRTSWLYGKHSDNNFVVKILNKLKENKKFKVVNDQTGCPTYTIDVARIIDRLLVGPRSGVLHVTNKCEGVSWYKFATKIAELAGYDKKLIIPCSTNEVETPAMRPISTVLSTKKLSQVIDIEIRTWDKALKDYLMEINVI
jgi:dTDP-4-dehydrorhamnose reductase